MMLNEQQLEAAKAYQSSKSNIAILARAGTGKTSFILALNKIRKSQGALYLAFTNATKEELIKRDPTLAQKVKTTYSIGMKACGRFIEEKLNVSKFKYQQIVDSLLAEDDFKAKCYAHNIQPNLYQGREAKKDLVRLIDSCLLNLAFDFYSIESIVNDRFIAFPDVEAWLVFKAIKIGLEDALNGEISFSDMISFPFSPYVDSEDLRGLFDNYPVVMVDEAQDLSMAQIRIVEEVSKGGQLVIVGDRNQSIFGFAGATGNSFDHLVKTSKASLYPMDLCYRCPVEVLDKARELVPDIRGLDRSGLVEKVLGFEDGLNLVKKLQKEETIICSRVNSRLITLAIELLDCDTPFNFHRDSIEQLLKGKLSFLKEQGPFTELESLLLAQKKAYTENRNSYQVDLVDCLLVILNKSGANKFSELYAFMRKLFFRRSAKLLLGTVHSFKGNEAKNVIGWGIEDFPHKLAVTALQLEQEMNLLYVLYTRAKENLYLVEIG